MSRTFSSRSSIEVLRREARRWLKSIDSGDPQALVRFRQAVPHFSGAPGLRAVQHALAREHGLASWEALKQELEDRARTHAGRVLLFLEKSVNRYGVDPATQKWGDYERDGPARGELAARLLAGHPEIADDSIHTAVAAHDLDAVRSWLAKNPALANDRSTFDGWTPLSRLTYARLPIERLTSHALQIATVLLDAGASPDAGWPRAAEFTPLVGVIGGGEHGQAPHPRAEDFARLLIARDADPFPAQALYNTSLGEDSTFWLDFLWSACETRGQTGKWTGPSPGALGGEGIPSALAYLLGNAVPRHLLRSRWLLEHGADARGMNFYSQMPVIKHALLEGRQEMVELLVQHGAIPPQLSDHETLIAAVAAGDIERVRELVHVHPEFLASPSAMFGAIAHKRIDIAEALLDLGMSPDVADEQGYSALHLAANHGVGQAVRLLIARGAQIDPFEQRHGGTPLTHACYHGRTDVIALLAPLSRNFRGLCFAGAVERIRELLTEEPDRANREDRPGEPALFCLPADEEKAVEVAELLLSCGADPTFRNPLGQTAAQAARRRGLDDAAALLEEAARPPPK
jgi:ankyrin repeat protein